MLRAMLALKADSGGQGNLMVAHFNHGYRGAAADADEAWLAARCRDMELRLVCGRADGENAANDHGDGWEAAARAARYRFLCRTAEDLGARFVAVAHTIDDQVETILHRILRGTGLDGLRGMPRHRPLSPSVTLMRPVLNLSRSEILQYLTDIGQHFCTDETNALTRWTRNRLRHELLPMLRQRYNPGVDQALLRLADQAVEAQQMLTDMAQQLADECVSHEVIPRIDVRSTVIRLQIDQGRLAHSPRPVVREVCRIAWGRAKWPMQAMGHLQWQQLAELIRGERQTPINLPSNVRAMRENGAVILESIG
jgi:tRNA(Ile)-lysidine synthase